MKKLLTISIIFKFNLKKLLTQIGCLATSLSHLALSYKTAFIIIIIIIIIIRYFLLTLLLLKIVH